MATTGGGAASSSCRLVTWCGWACARRSFSRSMSTSGWETSMLFRISLASLDGPLARFEFGGGERTGMVVVFARPSRAPYCSWAGWFPRRLRELCAAP